MQTDDLTGRTVLVTGAGSGIGRETALLSARRGARLVISDVNEAGLAETGEAIRALGREVLAERVDVADREQMRAHAASVHEQVGPVDLLVNNAGVGVAGTFLDTPLDDWDWVVQINLMGVVHGCHFFVPAMAERGSGHVVNVSSMAGYNASPALPAYSATKFAVLGLSEALREELKPSGVGVTAICPGLINTPITRNTRMRGEAADQRDKAIRLYQRRNYTPERVAGNILKSVQRGRVIAPVSPEAWAGYAMKRISPRFSGWLAGKMSEL
jgi:NAD(P)-dependent dehydrogenase (short-subunit alcohol dehydrogenase family)